MCCTFNMKAADQQFQDMVFTEKIMELQKRDLNNSFEDSTIPDEFKNKTEPSSKNGKNRGLEIILDAHTDIIEQSSVDQDFKVIQRISRIEKSI